MNITNATGSLKASFPYSYYDASDELQTDTISLTLKRMSFRNITAGKFQKAISAINEKPEEVANVLLDIVETWDIYLDDDGKQPFPLTLDNIVDRDPAFVQAMSTAVFEKLFPNPQKPQN